MAELDEIKNINDYYILNSGVKIPKLGFGTFLTPNDDTGVEAVLDALKAGYRHIDTAAGYKNESSVGEAVRKSGIDRKDIFITSKLFNTDHGYEKTVAAIEKSLENLQMDYIDLYLIHWPNPIAFRDRWAEANAGSWKAMEEYHKAGKLKAIGISNFQPKHIEELLKTAEIVPAVNQIRLCPGDVNEEQVNYCTSKGILLEAYAPLGHGEVFKVPEIAEIAEKYKKSVAQVCIRWSLQMGFLPLVKSVTTDRIYSNADIYDFELSDEDVSALKNMTGKCGFAKDPDTIEF